MGEWRSAAGFVAHLDFALSAMTIGQVLHPRRRDAPTEEEMQAMQAQAENLINLNNIGELPTWKQVLIIIALIFLIIFLSFVVVGLCVLSYLQVSSTFKLMEATQLGTPMSQAEIMERCKVYCVLHVLGMIVSWIFSVVLPQGPRNGRVIRFILLLTFVYIVCKFWSEMEVASNSSSIPPKKSSS